MFDMGPAVQSVFKAIRLQATRSWAVVLTTQEGDDHWIDGFGSAAEARSWIERETGQIVGATEDGGLASPGRAAA